MTKITKIAATEGGTYYLFYDDGSIFAITKEELREEEHQLEISRPRETHIREVSGTNAEMAE